jgi:hypothetical protein
MTSPRTIVLWCAAALAAAPLAACGGSPDDPPRSHFQPHALFRLEPIPNAGAEAGLGPHDDLGLRGTPAADTATRVLLLGGKFIYGLGKPVSETLPRLLEIRLASSSTPAAVANGGCPGQCLAAAALRYHFLLSQWKPTHVVYYPGHEDFSIYGAPDFVPDLNHVPRPWTGGQLREATALGPEGAAAYQRDIVSLDVFTRMNGATLVLANPQGEKLAAIRAIHWKVASQRKLLCVDLPESLEGAVAALAGTLAAK